MIGSRTHEDVDAIGVEERQMISKASRPNRSGRSGHFLDELRATFAARANQPAILDKNGSWTYADLDAKARRCAARLRRLGVEPGDRVAIVTPAKRPFLADNLGTPYAAAISLPMNPRF